MPGSRNTKGDFDSLLMALYTKIPVGFCHLISMGKELKADKRTQSFCWLNLA